MSEIPKTIMSSDQHVKSVFDNFALLRCKRELCDVVLKVGSRQIYAHKIVLCASSPYFRGMLTNGFAESKQTEIEIKEIDANIMENLVDFCYSAKIKIDEKSVQDLLSSAGLLQVFYFIYFILYLPLLISTPL